MSLEHSESFPSLQAWTAQVQAFMIEDSDYLRLLTWEALEGDDENIIAVRARRENWQTMVDQLSELMDQGLIPRLNPAQLQLSVYALVAFPVAFPQITRLITGLSVTDPKFLADIQVFLIQLINLNDKEQ